jgi:hypothetical protein
MEVFAIINIFFFCPLTYGTNLSTNLWNWVYYRFLIPMNQWAHDVCIDKYGLKDLQDFHPSKSKEFKGKVQEKIKDSVTKAISNAIQHTQIIGVDRVTYKANIEEAIWRDIRQMMPARPLTAATNEMLITLINQEVKQPVPFETFRMALQPSSPATTPS